MVATRNPTRTLLWYQTVFKDRRLYTKFYFQLFSSSWETSQLNEHFQDGCHDTNISNSIRTPIPSFVSTVHVLDNKSQMTLYITCAHRSITTPCSIALTCSLSTIDTWTVPVTCVTSVRRHTVIIVASLADSWTGKTGASYNWKTENDNNRVIGQIPLVYFPIYVHKIIL